MLRKLLHSCTFATIFIASFVSGRFGPFSFELDLCKDICSDSFFLLPLDEDSQAICQRGCRFFNIIDVKDERTLNDTNKECHISCAESYINKVAKGSCTIGCDTMSKKKQTDLQKFLPFLEQYSTDEQEFDSLEADLLDPLIRKQIMGYDVQYKIPEAYIRTMPIDTNNVYTVKPLEDRWICASILPLTILALFLFGLMLCTFKIMHLLNDEDERIKKTASLVEKVPLNDDAHIIEEKRILQTVVA